jgi:TonB family protein
MYRSLLFLLAALLFSAILANADDTRPDTAVYPMCRPTTTSLPELPEKLFHVGGGVSAPHVISRVDPKYSELARTARIEGVSVLNLVVDKDGFPRNVCVLRPLNDDLDQNAARAVSQWRFSPSMLDGQPVSVLISVEVAFHLTRKDSRLPDLKEDPVPQAH